MLHNKCNQLFPLPAFQCCHARFSLLRRPWCRLLLHTKIFLTIASLYLNKYASVSTRIFHYLQSKAIFKSNTLLIIMKGKCDLSQILTTPQIENSSSTIFLSASPLATASCSCFKSRKIARNRSQDVYLLPRGGSILINEYCSIMC